VLLPPLPEARTVMETATSYSIAEVRGFKVAKFQGFKVAKAVNHRGMAIIEQ
jgi:hypothetical protein